MYWDAIIDERWGHCIKAQVGHSVTLVDPYNVCPSVITGGATVYIEGLQ